MSSKELWFKLRSKVHELQTLKESSETFENLVSSGIRKKDLLAYIELGCPRKHPSSIMFGLKDLDLIKKDILKNNGYISGGTAFREHMKLIGDEKADLDIFYNSFPDFVQNHLRFLNIKNIDICLFENKPWELFDLECSCCSFSGNGWDNSVGFQEFTESKISDIRLECIVHPKASFQRIIKYGKKYNIKFNGSKLYFMASSKGIPEDIIDEAKNMLLLNEGGRFRSSLPHFILSLRCLVYKVSKFHGRYQHPTMRKNSGDALVFSESS